MTEGVWAVGHSRAISPPVDEAAVPVGLQRHLGHSCLKRCMLWTGAALSFQESRIQQRCQLDGSTNARYWTAWRIKTVHQATAPRAIPAPPCTPFCSQRPSMYTLLQPAAPATQPRSTAAGHAPARHDKQPAGAGAGWHSARHWSGAAAGVAGPVSAAAPMEEEVPPGAHQAAGGAAGESLELCGGLVPALDAAICATTPLPCPGR